MIILPSVSEVSVERVKRLLNEEPEIQIWNDHQPQFTILSMERYRELTDAAVPLSSASATPAVSEEPFAVSALLTPAENEPIPVWVKRVFHAYCARNRLPREEVERLCNADYSHHTLGTPPSWPALKLYNPALPLAAQAKVRGYNRYYASHSEDYPLSFYGAQYLLCNHWVERNKDKFSRWARRWE